MAVARRPLRLARRRNCRASRGDHQSDLRARHAGSNGAPALCLGVLVAKRTPGMVETPGIVTCDACPVLCRIRDGKTGACDRYGNVAGKLTRLDPMVLTAQAA